MELIAKFYNEHRIAFDAITAIESSNDVIEIKKEKVLKLFSEELLPHFKQEEEELFSDDFGSKVLLKEHEHIYDLIDKIKYDKSGKYIQPFLTLMKDHIRTEEQYFRSLIKKDIIIPYIIIAVIAFIAGITVAMLFSLFSSK